ncbi:hypothetical protein Dsin_027897 [Dipteronia sinensis]|uniref:DDE Tnp4 domain-containing protein n=1 Tax=Dipteronia sinensis TaxID=43782 RepID=A0AAE0DU11_9ROSI|nr:hypothetical protein Dsin_027897 [Dipteronia sinensis]
MIGVVILTMFLTLDLVKRQYEMNMLRKRSYTNNQTRLLYLNSIIGGRDIDCVNQLRMVRRTIGILCELLRTDGKLKTDGVVTIEELVCFFLHVLAHHVKNRTISNRFNRSRETISRYFNYVLLGVIRLQGSLLHKPNHVPKDYTDRKWKWCKNYLGALDETHIKVRVSKNDKPRYRTRKGEIATNVLGVCSQNMKFIFVYPGWECSASDSKVLHDALSKPTGLKVPAEHEVTEIYDFKDEDVETISTIDSSYEWTMWRNNLAMDMFDEWRGTKSH